MTTQVTWLSVIFCIWKISSLKVMDKNLAARNLSVPLKLSSDSFLENLKKLDTIQLMTILVSMMKMESFWTVFWISESSQRPSSNLKKSLLIQRVEKTHHLILILSLKLQVVRKMAAILGEFHWLIPRTTSNFFIQEQSETEFTKSEVLLIAHGMKDNAI